MGLHKRLTRSCFLSRSHRRAVCPLCQSAVLCDRCAHSSAEQIHRDECSALRRLAAAPPEERPKSTRSLRLLIRCLCARRRAERSLCGQAYVGADGEWWGDGDVAVDELEDIDALVGVEQEAAMEAEAATEEDEYLGDKHGETRSRFGLVHDLLEMAKQARYFSDSNTRLGHEMCATLMGQLCCNSLTMYGTSAGDEGVEVGVALSASVAMFNHDCQPNATWGLDASGCLVVHATADVNAGEELCLSYVDPRLAAAVRRRFLRRHFFFECVCVACAAGEGRWTCALCLALNAAFHPICAGCGGARYEAPVQNKRKRRKRLPPPKPRTVALR